MSDPDLIEAFRKQCKFAPEPGLIYLAWSMSGEVKRGEVSLDDLIDVMKEFSAGNESGDDR